MVVPLPSQHVPYHSLIEVREELDNVVVDEHVVREDVSDGLPTDTEASLVPPSMSISPCSWTEQWVELSTLADFVTCRDVQAPLQIVPAPEIPKLPRLLPQLLPTLFTRSMFSDDFRHELETLGEFVGLRHTSNSGPNSTSSPTSLSAPTAPTRVAHNTTRNGSSVVITNEIGTRERQQLSKPPDQQPDPPADRTGHRTTTAATQQQQASATVICAARTGSEVYMCPVAPTTPSTPRDHEYRYTSDHHHHHGTTLPDDTVRDDDAPIPNLSSLHVLPEETEPLVAILDDEESSGRTSMRAVRDEDSSSISYYQPRPRRQSALRPRSPSSPVAHVSYTHGPSSSARAASDAGPTHRTTQGRSSVRPNRPNPNPPTSSQSNSKNRVKVTSTREHPSNMIPSQPTLQRHQSHPYRQQYPQQATSRRYPQEPPPSHRRRTTAHPSYRPPESEASTTTETTNCSSDHPYHPYYSHTPDSDTVRAVAPRKPPTGTFSQEESSAVSSTGQQKVMIVVVRRPNHTSSSPHRHHQYHSNDMDLL